MGFLDAPARPGAPATYRRDIRDFLLAGETLDRTGASSMSTVLQRAVDALTAEYTAQSATWGRLGYQIVFPNGKYRFDTQVNWKTGVGVVGAGRSGTVFMPTGVVAMFRAGLPGGVWNAANTFDDCVFTDFTVDCSLQTDTAYNSAVKAFYIQGARRMRIERVTAKHAWGTQFGNDWLIDSTYVDCVSIGSGRGMVERDPTGTHKATGAGFGMATGFEKVETLTLVNCLARDCWSAGYFSEWANHRSAPYRPSGMVLNNCTALNCNSGVQDSGSTGLQVIGGTFANNILAGVLLCSTSATDGKTGREGVVTGALLTGNGHGVVCVDAALDSGYTFRDCTIVENLGHGVWTSAETHGLTILGGRVLRNGGAGVLLQGPTTRTRVVGAAIGNNGTDTAASYRDGISIVGACTWPVITENDVYTNSSPATQQGGIVRRSTGTITAPRVQRNNVSGHGTGAQVSMGDASTTYITDNALLDTALSLAERLSAAVGGATPFVAFSGDSSTEAFPAISPAVSLAQPITLYAVADVAPTANRRVMIRESSTSYIDVGRNSGGTAWLGLGRNDAGTAVTPTITATSAPAVVCTRRTATEVALHIRGGSSATAAITSYPATATASQLYKQTGFKYAVGYAGDHDVTTRTAVMDILAAEFGIA